MIKRITQLIILFVACISVSSIQAHHSNGMFDISTQIWLKGTVVGYEAANPHAMIELEEQVEGGQSRRWTVEGPNPARLERLDIDDDFINIGDMIAVCGFFLKSDAARDSWVHGHVLVMQDGRTWQWGPYGQLESCVNPDDWNAIERGRNQLRVN